MCWEKEAGRGDIIHLELHHFQVARLGYDPRMLCFDSNLILVGLLVGGFCLTVCLFSTFPKEKIYNFPLSLPNSYLPSQTQPRALSPGNCSGLSRTLVIRWCPADCMPQMFIGILHKMSLQALVFEPLVQ